MDMFTQILIFLLFPVALIASNVWLRTTVQRDVNHRYDKKIEELKSDLRNTEETFRAELRQKEQEISALRDGAMAMRAQRLAMVDKRRLEAVEKLWEATKDLGAFKHISNMATIIKFDEAAKRAKSDPEIRELFKSMAGPALDRSEPTGAAESEEPFLSPQSWALFSSYKAILGFAVARWKLLVVGLGDEKFLKDAQLREMLSTTLPDRAKWIATADIGAFHFLLDELEAKLLAELRRTLAGHEDDEEAVRRAATISKLAASATSPEQAIDEARIPPGLIQHLETPEG